MRTFETGATRDDDATKIDYEGFLSPVVLERFGQYMTEHRFQADGQIRDSDNWQKGIPQDVYIKSLFRHFMDLWKFNRGGAVGSVKEVEDAACAIMFNIMGWLHEFLKLADPGESVSTTEQGQAVLTVDDIAKIVNDYDAEVARQAGVPAETAHDAVDSKADYLQAQLDKAIANLPNLSDVELQAAHEAAIANIGLPTMAEYHNAIDNEGFRRERNGGAQ